MQRACSEASAGVPVTFISSQPFCYSYKLAFRPTGLGCHALVGVLHRVDFEPETSVEGESGMLAHFFKVG